MSLYGTDMDFRTIYRLDYTQKKGSLLPYTPPHDSNPVSSPWKQYLVPDESLKHLLPADAVYEDPACVLHRAYQNHMPDLKLAKQQYQRDGQSLYQVDFCKLGDFESKKTRDAKIVPLPPNWSTPLSTQRCSYRDPKSIMTLAAEPPRFRYRDNLVPNETERRILRVSTGVSDYMGNVGSLGDFILREKLHGAGKPRGMSVWEVKRRLALLDQGVIVED
ncbi:uncharacterized protein LOC117642094 [Thrips palmi]|uniref:Uncharacterized protein LOC117642094 n=1 Tax=Thrips palmi TaxID=161013 RepID=A0A6P8YGZ3_THRPL|nr:uncharacterized protein LOC117642094 [Thrips palmi]